MKIEKYGMIEYKAESIPTILFYTYIHICCPNIIKTVKRCIVCVSIYVF